jgi:membrane carboxypeptidase/penicillin-binding protein PbpC
MSISPAFWWWRTSRVSPTRAKLLITGDERSPVRKLRELLYAVEMERTLGKPRILRLYLDNAPWVRACAGPRPLPSTTSACERTN